MFPNQQDFAQRLPVLTQGVGTRATADNHVYPCRRHVTSNEALHRRPHHPSSREDSGVYMPSGPAEITGNSSESYTSTFRPQAQSNPFEDPQYEYGAIISASQPPSQRQRIPEDEHFSPPANSIELKKSKGHRSRLRDCVRAMFTSSKKNVSERQQPEARSTLLAGQGTHFRRGTVRGQQWIDRQRKTEAGSLWRDF
jgi:hypothetical protein